MFHTLSTISTLLHLGSLQILPKRILWSNNGAKKSRRITGCSSGKWKAFSRVKPLMRNSTPKNTTLTNPCFQANSQLRVLPQEEDGPQLQELSHWKKSRPINRDSEKKRTSSWGLNRKSTLALLKVKSGSRMSRMAHLIRSHQSRRSPRDSVWTKSVKMLKWNV